jgi:hypothetical protein
MSSLRTGLLRAAVISGNGLAKRLIVALVLFSSLITAIITAVELHADYRRDIEQINRAFDFIGRSYLPSLVDSVWVSDREQVQTQLDGLLQLPDVEFIGVAVDGTLRWSAGQAQSMRTVSTQIPLLREHRGQQLTIGNLHVVASVDRVLARIWDRLLLVLAANAIKTLLVAAFLLLLFQALVTRHLTRIAEFVRGLQPGAASHGQLQLARPRTGRWRPDALDAIADAVNGMTASLQRTIAELRRSEAELARSEERFRLAMAAAGEALWDYDVASGRIEYSSGWASLLGQGTDALAPALAGWESRLHPDERETVLCALNEHLQGRSEVFSCEHRLRRADGHWHWVLGRGRVISRDAGGRPLRMVGTIKDIDARKRVEQRLRDSEARYRAMVEAQSDAVCRWLPDTTLTFTNAGYRSMFGLDEREATGRKWLDFVPEEERVGLARFIAELAADPRTISYEHPVFAADGSVRHFLWTDVPLFGAAGDLVEFQSVGRDITERKQAEAALRDSERRYRELFEANPHPMWVYDLQTLRFLAVNDAAVAHYGYGRDEFLAMTIADIRPPQDVPRLLENVARVEDGKADRAGVWRHRRHDGSVIDVQISSHTIDIDGRRAELVLAHDVTQQRRAERELRRANRALRTLTECNQVLVRASDETELLQEVCRLIIDFGGYRMSWIGMAQDDAARSVRPVAAAGFDAGYLDTLRVSWADDEFGRGPTGTAIRERRPSIACDIGADPRFAPWREAARQSGYASSIALPLIADDGRCFGALNIYCVEPDAFDASEVGFLTELASDIAYGLRALRDRAARNDAEQQLRSTVQRLQHLMQTSPIVLYSLRLADGRLETAEVSENIGRILGYTLAEVRAPDWWFDHVHPDDRAEAAAATDRLLKAGQYAHEYRIRHKDGHYVWVRDSLRVIHDQAGVAVEVVGAWFDISERRQSEENLRIKEAAMASSLAGIVLADTDGRVTYVNPAFCRMWGVDEDQVLGTSTSGFWVEPEQCAEVLRKLLEHGAWSGELRARRGDGSHFDAELLASLVRGAQGEPLCLMGSFVDITESRQAREALRDLTQTLERRVRERTAELTQATARAERASRAKSEFLSRMSHELRTPLNAVLGFAQILELSNPNERQRTWAREIRRAGDHLLELIEQLLDLSRIEVGRLPLRIEAQAVAPIVREAVSIVQPLIEERGVQLALSGLDESAAALVDSTRLRQILVNFLSNAVKFNRPDGGRITVTCSAPEADRLRLTVTDTGIGIAPEKLDSLFQPFERLGVEARGIDGTGIGLALSKQLAELMHARIGAESVTEQGSSFWIDLPRAAAAAVHDLHLVPRPALTGQPIRLLYVEDNVVNLEVMRGMLAAYPNVKLFTTDDGAEAIEVARSHQPALILLDIHMPKMDGFAILRKLRGHPQTRAIPVVAVTADAMPDEVERGLAAGFVRYLTKPVAQEALLELIAEFSASAAVAADSRGERE